MLVCRRWRAVAMEHPDYWSRLELRDTSKPLILKLCASRLDYAGARACRVRVTGNGGDRAGTTLRNTILPIVRRHLRHISILQINVAEIDIEALFTALNVPAPMLERLDIYVESLHERDDGSVAFPSIPTDLFGHSAPRLTTMYLMNIGQLHGHPASHPPPPWFAQIRKLHVTFVNRGEDLPIVWHEAMPNVQTLRPVTSGGLHPMYQHQVPTPLQRLECLSYFPADFSLNQFPDVIISGTAQSSDAIAQLFEVFSSHNSGPLELRLAVDEARWFTTTISSIGQVKRVRTVHSARAEWEGVDPYRVAAPRNASASDWYLNSEPNDLFTHQDIFDRVEALEAPLSLLVILEQHLPSRMSRLAEVVVLITADVGQDVFDDCSNSHKHERRPISCPNLAVLRVRDVHDYRRPRVVDRARLLDILSVLFDPLPALTAVNVDISGSE